MHISLVAMHNTFCSTSHNPSTRLLLDTFLSTPLAQHLLLTIQTFIRFQPIDWIIQISNWSLKLIPIKLSLTPFLASTKFWCPLNSWHQQKFRADTWGFAPQCWWDHGVPPGIPGRDTPYMYSSARCLEDSPRDTRRTRTWSFQISKVKCLRVELPL